MKKLLLISVLFFMVSIIFSSEMFIYDNEYVYSKNTESIVNYQLQKDFNLPFEKLEIKNGPVMIINEKTLVTRTNIVIKYFNFLLDQEIIRKETLLKFLDKQNNKKRIDELGNLEDIDIEAINEEINDLKELYYSKEETIQVLYRNIKEKEETIEDIHELIKKTATPPLADAVGNITMGEGNNDGWFGVGEAIWNASGKAVDEYLEEIDEIKDEINEINFEIAEIENQQEELFDKIEHLKRILGDNNF